MMKELLQRYPFHMMITAAPDGAPPLRIGI
jgi:hypothetical protein